MKRGRRSPESPKALAALLACAALSIARPLQAAPQLEGPLDNDAYLPVDAAAELELAAGDQAYLSASRAAPGADAAARWTTACERWRNALLRAPPGSSVSPRPVTNPAETSPWPATDGARDRYTEGLEAALVRRLFAMPPEGRAVWRERFTPLARAELSRALGSAEPERELARVERELPATEPAVRAALALAELAHERGEFDSAEAWLARAERQLALLAGPGSDGARDGAAQALSAAVRRRRALLPMSPEPEREAWESASALEPLGRFDLERPRGAPARPRALGSGPQAGLGFLAGENVLVQTASALWTLGPSPEPGRGDQTAGVLRGPFENRDWLAAVEFPPDVAVATVLLPGATGVTAPGWRLDPAVRGTDAIVVVGRSLGGRVNALARVELDTPDGAPRVVWARAATDVAPREPREGAGEDAASECEFQPGPLWIGERVFTLVRRASAASGERELELRALDARDGSLLWSRYLGKGGERVRDAGRFAPRGAPSIPAEPLVACAGGIFAAGPLGFACLVEPLDGRPRFAVRGHRRAPERSGWTGWGGAAAADGRGLAWAPADGDFLYWLDTGEAPAGPSPIAAAPLAIGEAEALVAADRAAALVLARSGARWTLARLDFASGGRSDALRLGPEEVFAGRALAGRSRVLAASDRALYLFDRERDLALIATASLVGPAPRGGNVLARKQRVYVVSNAALEIFQAR